MLTDLKFLEVGQPFPPTSETERINNYHDYKKLFEGKHSDVYQHQFQRIKRINNGYTDIVSYDIILNYHQLITKKTADLLVGEPPRITVQDKNKQKILDEIMSKNDVLNLMYIVAIDVSRYGVGLFYIYKEANKGVIDVTQPAIWFPILNPRNIRKIQYHVLCIPVITNEKRGEIELFCEIHERGKYTIKHFLLKNGVIAKEFNDEKVIETGLDDFAVIPVTNLVTSDNIFGISDYDAIDTLVSELEVRFSQISKILDKHAEPSMQGPSSALTYDKKTGTYSLKTGNYFIVEVLMEKYLTSPGTHN